MTHTFVELHALQTVPPSNINRDDTGSPKTAVFGGIRRARVSSQAWKRAIRTSFRDTLDPSRLGTRTKRVVKLLAEEIRRQDPAVADATGWAELALKAAGIVIEKPKRAKNEDAQPESKYLLFLSHGQIGNLARVALEARADGAKDVDKKKAKAAADTQHSVDVALFGRMVADATDLTVDATAQVAHAISVHAVDNEFDFYTAVDDLKANDDAADAGAGMIGTVEFNSSTLYRYATVNVHGLRNTLGDDAATVEAVRAFVRAFVVSMPTGKQNTFANRTLPDAVIATVRSEQPINLVGAFEEAVTSPSHGGRLAEASRHLVAHAEEIEGTYGGDGRVASFVVRIGEATESLAALGDEVNLDGLVDGVGTVVAERIGASS
jgi:CRISPR system Cascade subunit CasC